MPKGNIRTWHTRGGLEAGRIDEDDLNFLPPNVGPNALIDESNLERVRARSRYMVDNNPLFDGSLDLLVSKIVGLGIVPAAATPWPEVNSQINQLLAEASEAVDPGRCMSLDESQELFFREVFTAGDCGVRTILGEAFAGYDAGPAIELIDPDRIDIELELNAKGKNRVRQGVEFDERGRVVAYHILTEHPNDDGNWQLGTARVGDQGVMRIPVEEMDLAFRRRRIDQLRGLPKPMSSMRAARREEGVDRDAAMAARIQAVMPMFIKGAGGAPLQGSQPSSSAFYIDAAGNPITNIYGPTIGRIPHGAEVATVQSTQPGPQYETHTSVMQRRAARGLGTTYAEHSGDYGRTTFSSSRAERNDILPTRRKIQAFIFRHHTRRWARMVVHAAHARGQIELSSEQLVELRKRPTVLTAVTMHAPGEPYVNPLQEATAHGEDLENGVRSPQEVIRARGGNPADVMRETLEWERDMEAERQRMGLDTPPDRDSRSAERRDAARKEKDEPPPGGKGLKLTGDTT